MFFHRCVDRENAVGWAMDGVLGGWANCIARAVTNHKSQGHKSQLPAGADLLCPRSFAPRVGRVASHATKTRARWRARAWGLGISVFGPPTGKRPGFGTRPRAPPAGWRDSARPSRLRLADTRWTCLGGLRPISEGRRESRAGAGARSGPERLQSIARKARTTPYPGPAGAGIAKGQSQAFRARCLDAETPSAYFATLALSER